MLKKIFKKIISPNVRKKVIQFKNNHFDGHAVKSYSQEGEDLILNRIFEGISKGFFVDVGAHHPFRFSNTYFFYKKGWSGINIDAMPGSMNLFHKFRSRDINLELPISDVNQKLTYYSFNEPALNTFSPKLRDEQLSKNPNYIVEKEIVLETHKLSDVLDKYLPPSTKINFLSIDVEGVDINVLRSNDWTKYLPDVVLVEVLESNLNGIQESEVYKILKNYNYIIYAKCVNTVFFAQKSFIQ